MKNENVGDKSTCSPQKLLEIINNRIRKSKVERYIW